MANDWMKVEKHTPDKAEVYAIADALNIDPDAVFGKCFRVWCWFDSNTTNGKTNGVCVSKNLIDRLVCVQGFADAMISVGWLVADGIGVAANNFDRHNGETAKQRGLGAKRAAKFSGKTNANTNGELTQVPLAREEKRREDINTSAMPDGFAEFWSAYPKKKSKGDAEKVWKRIKPDAELRERITSSLGAMKASSDWLKDGGQFIPYPASWLNAKGWDDEVTDSVGTGRKNPFEGAL